MNKNGQIPEAAIAELRAGVESLRDFVAAHDKAVAVKAALAHAEAGQFWAGPRGQIVAAPEPVVAALDAAEIPAGPRRDAAIAAGRAAFVARIRAIWPAHWFAADGPLPEDCEKCGGNGFAWGKEDGPACTLCNGHGTVPEDYDERDDEDEPDMPEERWDYD